MSSIGGRLRSLCERRLLGVLIGVYEGQSHWLEGLMMTNNERCAHHVSLIIRWHLQSSVSTHL